MGGFKSFEDCVEKIEATGKTEEQAKRICGAIKKREEGEITERMLIELFEREDYIEKINLSVDKSQLTNGIMELDMIPLTEGVWNNTFYSHKELKKAYKQIEGMPITIDHSKSVKDLVGFFGKPRYYKGIKVNAFIDDPKIVSLLQRGYHKHIGVSMELYGNKVRNPETKQMEMKNIEFVRGSLVLDPACPKGTCTIHPKLSNDEHVEELASYVHDELITKCEQRYMTPDMERFKKGFPGCIETMKACRGYDEKHAIAMCNYIFHRRGGKGVRRKESIEEIIKLFNDYEDAENKQAFIDMIDLAVRNPEAVCGAIWFKGTEAQRKAFAGGTKGRSRKQKPPREWWQDCIKKVKGGKLQTTTDTIEEDIPVGRKCPEGKKWDKKTGKCIEKEGEE
jgi:hypothetical protein